MYVNKIDLLRASAYNNVATSYMLTECDITILKNIYYYVGLKYVCQRIGIFDT